MPVLPETIKSHESGILPFKAIGFASIAVGVAALGLYVGRELRSRYKFKRRTPYDRYSQAGGEGTTEFGVGV